MGKQNICWIKKSNVVWRNAIVATVSTELNMKKCVWSQIDTLQSIFFITFLILLISFYCWLDPLIPTMKQNLGKPIHIRQNGWSKTSLRQLQNEIQEPTPGTGIWIYSPRVSEPSFLSKIHGQWHVRRHVNYWMYTSLITKGLKFLGFELFGLHDS